MIQNIHQTKVNDDKIFEIIYVFLLIGRVIIYVNSLVSILVSEIIDEKNIINGSI
jgi:hypothetical protein